MIKIKPRARNENPLYPFALAEFVDPIMDDLRRAMQPIPPGHLLKLDVQLGTRNPKTYCVFGICGEPDSPRDDIAKYFCLFDWDSYKAVLSFTMQPLPGLTVQAETATHKFWHCLVVALRVGAKPSAVHTAQCILQSALLACMGERSWLDVHKQWKGASF